MNPSSFEGTKTTNPEDKSLHPHGEILQHKEGILGDEKELNRIQRLLNQDLVEDIAELKSYPECVSTKEAQDLAFSAIVEHEIFSPDDILRAERIRKIFKLDDQTYIRAADSMVEKIFQYVNKLSRETRGTEYSNGRSMESGEDWRETQGKIFDNYKLYEDVIAYLGSLPAEYLKSSDFKIKAEQFAVNLLDDERIINDVIKYTTDEDGDVTEKHLVTDIDHARRRDKEFEIFKKLTGLPELKDLTDFHDVQKAIKESLFYGDTVNGSFHLSDFLELAELVNDKEFFEEPVFREKAIQFLLKGIPSRYDSSYISDEDLGNYKEQKQQLEKRFSITDEEIIPEVKRQILEQISQYLTEERHYASNSEIIRVLTFKKVNNFNDNDLTDLLVESVRKINPENIQFYRVKDFVDNCRNQDSTKISEVIFSEPILRQKALDYFNATYANTIENRNAYGRRRNSDDDFKKLFEEIGPILDGDDPAVQEYFSELIHTGGQSPDMVFQYIKFTDNFKKEIYRPFVLVEIEEITNDGLSKYDKNKVDTIAQHMEKYNLQADEETKDALAGLLAVKLEEGEFEGVEMIKQQFPDIEKLARPLILEVYERCILAKKIDIAEQIKKVCAISDAEISKIKESKEYSRAANSLFTDFMRKGEYEKAKKLLGDTTIDKDTVRKIVLGNLRDLMSIEGKYNINLDSVKGIIKNFPLENSDIENDHELIKAVREQIFSEIGHSKSNNAVIYYKLFNSNPVIFDDIETVNELKRLFISSLDKDYDDLGELVKNFPIMAEIKHDPEVMAKCIAKFITILEKGNIEKAVIFYKDVMPEALPSEVIKSIPKINAIFTSLNTKNPQVVEKYLSSSDIFLSVFPDLYETEANIQELTDQYPFLVKALEENARFGIKLLLKFPELDSLSRSNIAFLYENKDQLLKNQEGLDPDSTDFRVAIQNILKGYRRNSEILGYMERGGVNLSAWLDYREEEYFDLGRENTQKFSEAIVTPIERIKETIRKYGEIVKDSLSDYRPELLNHKTTLKDIDDLKKQLAQLQNERNKAIVMKDQKKVSGLDKGIKNLEQQIENPKMLPLWDKVFGDLTLVERVQKDVFTAHDNLKLLENELDSAEKKTEGTQKERRKKIVEFKSKLEKAKNELKAKFSTLEDRMENFQSKLEGILASGLGQDRASAIRQEIQQNISEGMDHYNTDISTLSNLFNESDEDDIAGQPMKISLWSRNPDVDLYLGNYTNCCIRIDSDHMGEESTIADYLTDLGIQVVVISDEKKRMPVVAAWCWTGQTDDGEVSFVIDNIEANTEYSKKYRPQFEKELKKYIENYAKAAGMKAIEQGPKNNDLVVAKFGENHSKLGWYNRPSGYFLEAEV